MRSTRVTDAPWFSWAMSAGAVAAAFGLMAVFAHHCEQDDQRMREWHCSPDGRRVDMERWLRDCLHESARTTTECEAFAHRQAYESGICRAEGETR